MDIEIRAEAVMEGRDYLALTRFMTNGKNKNSIMMNILLLLIAIVGVYADFKVNQKPTIITIVAVIAVLGAFLLPELSARRFIKNDKTFIGHTMRYVFNDNGINVLDEQAGTTALHAWNNIMNMYETAEYFFCSWASRAHCSSPSVASPPRTWRISGRCSPSSWGTGTKTASKRKNPNKESTYESGFSLVRFPGRG